MKLSKMQMALGVITILIITNIVFLVLWITNRDSTNNRETERQEQENFVEQYAKTVKGKSVDVNTITLNSGTTCRNPFLQFDRIYYVNLDKRPDRKYELLRELRKMNVPADRVQRVSGVIDKFGALGCSKAHLNALLDCKARGLSNCLVLEDDFVFKFGKEHTYSQLNKFWDLGVQWDLLMLSSFTRQFEKTSLDFLIHVTEGQTTGGYAVNGHFLDKLIENVSQGIQYLETLDKPDVDHCIDAYWKQLQPSSKWYTFRPVMGHQRDAYSDIEERFVSYPDKKEVVETVDQYEYLIMVKSCQHRLLKNKSQLNALNTICRDHPTVRYYTYYGNENLDQEFVIDEQNHLITLKCKDDYVNLCHKFGQLLHCLINYIGLNQSCQSLKGVFFTDDDIVVKPEHFYSFLQEHCNNPYFGYVQGTKFIKQTSYHFKSKCEESKVIHKLVHNTFPSLLKTPVHVPLINYCPGGGFFLQVPSIHLLSEETDLFAPFPEDEEELEYHKKDGVYFDLPAFDDMNISVGLFRHNIEPSHVKLSTIVEWDGLIENK